MAIYQLSVGLFCSFFVDFDVIYVVIWDQYQYLKSQSVLEIFSMGPQHVETAGC